MTNKPQNPENQAKGDDRNIVTVDPGYEGASFEDRLFLLWHEYKKPVIAIFTIVVLALIGWGIAVVVQDRYEARVASEYREASEEIDQLRAFAERRSGHPLAGVAYIGVADHHFGNGEYEQAARYYQLAARGLANTPPAGRAHIGRGVSLALSGNQEEALTQFEQVGRNPENFAIVRAEAYYHAATLAVEAGRAEAARQYIESVIEIDQSRVWASRAMGLERALPQVAEEPEGSIETEVSDAS